MIECCKKPRGSRFCSDCGRRLHNHTLDDLLDHLHKNTLAAQSYVAFLEESPPASPAYLLRRNELAAKWENWEDELRVLLSKEGQP